jgi:hypothetical protein
MRLEYFELVDPFAQVFQDKILLGGRLAFVDFLRPLLERQLDPESLVDRECDIEEVQAVDAEVVDRVAFRRDVFTGNVAGLGDDIGDRVEGRGHEGSPLERRAALGQSERAGTGAGPADFLHGFRVPIAERVRAFNAAASQ